MTLFVVGGVLFVLSSWWCTSVLTDEALYLRAVAPLGSSRLFARLASHAVTRSAHQHLGRCPLVGTRVTRAAGTITRHVMSTRSFERAWPLTQRLTHRGHCRGRLPGSRLRSAAAMVFLATLGSVLRISRGAVGPLRRTRAPLFRAGR